MASPILLKCPDATKQPLSRLKRKLQQFQRHEKETLMFLRRGEWWLLGPMNLGLHTINVLPHQWLLSLIISLPQSWQVTSHFQSSQISGKFDFRDENYEDDDSHGTPPQVDKAADPLFKPVFSLPTWDTVDSQTSSGWAPNITYFFIVYGKEEAQKWVCKICGWVLA